MKDIAKVSLFVLTINLFIACDSGKSKEMSVETAEQTNKVTLKNDITSAAESEFKVASDFMVEAESGSLMEVTLGKLAQKQSQNPAVQNFGKRMETDHEKASQQLNLLGNAKKIVLPASPSNEHQKHINELAELQGPAFDKKYMDMMVADHQKDIRLFEEAASNNKMDVEVKAFAEKTLPVLRQHLQLAQQTQETVK